MPLWKTSNRSGPDPTRKPMPNIADTCHSGRRISPAAAPAPASSSTNAWPGSPTPSGEGARTFIHVDAKAAIEAAEAMDRLREVKAAPSPLRRHSGFDQGSVRHQGPGDPRRLARARRFAARGSRRAGGGAAAACRLHRDRPHQHDRIRLFRDRHQSALRHPEERLAAQRRPCARRIVVGSGGIRRRRHGAWRARHRHRRIVPDSGGL